MTSISPPSSHLLKMKLITVWNGRMPDGGVVQAVTTSTAVKQTNDSLFYHLSFLIQKQKLFFLLLDFPILDHLLFICQWCWFSLCLLAVVKSVVNCITLIKKCNRLDWRIFNYVKRVFDYVENAAAH